MTSPLREVPLTTQDLATDNATDASAAHCNLAHLSPAAPTSATEPGSLAPNELVALTKDFAKRVAQGMYRIGYNEQTRWHERIYRDESVDVWLISWLPSQGTQLHDHGGSSGAFTVVSGQLEEAVFIANGPKSGTLRDRVHPAGMSVGFDERYIHDVRNTSSAMAVSVHAYSSPLVQMNYYDVDDGELVQLLTVDTSDPEPIVDEAIQISAQARYGSVDALLQDARSRLRRVTADQARSLITDGARIVDIRPHAQRVEEGEIPGSVVVERNHLEWRLHPSSDNRLEWAREGQRWIVVCSEGFTSSLAADALQSLGVAATDLVGGVSAWRAAGFATVPGGTPKDTVVSP